MFLYVLTNKVNGKQYVGKSVNDPISTKSGRVYMHLNGYDPKCRAIHNAVNNYGKDNFDVHVSHFPHWNRRQLAIGESTLVKELDTLAPNGYNLVDPDENEYRVSKETRKKRSETMTGRVRTAEHCINISNGKKGGKAWNEGMSTPDKVKQKISNSLKGRTLTDEHRRNVSKAQKGKKRGTYKKRLRKSQV